MKDKAEKFQVIYVFADMAYIVMRTSDGCGIIVGTPDFFESREAAQKHADKLNKLHGL